MVLAMNWHAAGAGISVELGAAGLVLASTRAVPTAMHVPGVSNITAGAGTAAATGETPWFLLCVCVGGGTPFKRNQRSAPHAVTQPYKGCTACLHALSRLPYQVACARTRIVHLAAAAGCLHAHGQRCSSSRCWHRSYGGRKKVAEAGTRTAGRQLLTREPAYIR